MLCQISFLSYFGIVQLSFVQYCHNDYSCEIFNFQGQINYAHLRIIQPLKFLTFGLYGSQNSATHIYTCYTHISNDALSLYELRRGGSRSYRWDRLYSLICNIIVEPVVMQCSFEQCLHVPAFELWWLIVLI